MKILTGNKYKPLAEAISAKLANCHWSGRQRIFVEILENVRGEDAFVIPVDQLPGAAFI